MSQPIAWLARIAVLIGALSITGTAEARQGGETDCAYAFTSGTGQALLTWCVSTDGNLVSLKAPTFEHIKVFTVVEGYAVCTGTTVIGYDAAEWGEAGWGPPTTVSVSGSGVTIKRSTTDGSITTTTKFSHDTPNRQVNVQVTIKNTGNVKLLGLRYSRFADLDVFGQTQNNWLETTDTVIAERSSIAVSLGTHTFNKFHTLGIVGFDALTHCEFHGAASSPTSGDYVAKITHHLGDLAPGLSKTVKFVYRRQ